MIKKIERVSKKLFQEVFEKGRSFNTPLFSIKMDNSKDEISHFSVVVPKSIFKKAHDRNKIRRIFYATIKNNTNFEFLKNKVIIFICKKEIKNSTKEETISILNNFIDKK